MENRKDHEKIHYYLQKYCMESVFNEPLLPYLSLYHYDQGELICSQGEKAQLLYVLVKGKVKIYTSSAEGKTLILSFNTPLEVIGDIEYVQGIDIINTVEAVSPVSMIGVPYRWLKEYGNDYSPLLQFLLEIITRKFYIKSNSSRFNLMYPVEVRLASYLLSVSFDETDSLFEGRIRTGSLTDAANLIGTSYRHLNRVIRRFCEEGLLERKRGFILVKSKKGLESLVNHNIYEKPYASYNYGNKEEKKGE